MENKKHVIAIYPGSFDPITYGHIDIIKRAAILFDEVIVSVAVNILKTPLLSVKERVDLIEESVKDISGVRVESFDCLVVDYVQKSNAKAIIRGLRAVSDFEYELQMALVNRKLDDSIITVFLTPHENYSYLNSSIVKELFTFNGNIDCFVPSHVKDALSKAIKKN